MSEKLNMQNHKVSKELLLDTAEKYLENAMDNLESEHPQNVRKYPEIELNTVEVPTNMVAVLNAIYLNFVKPTRNQPQLTIQKRVADIIDGYCKHNFTADRLIMMAYRDYKEFNDWIKKDWVKNNNIARAYLAGKALGVYLVKVVEG